MKLFIFSLLFTYSGYCIANIKLEGTYAFPRNTTYLTIYKNGESFEGKISWVKNNRKDVFNPNPELRNRDYKDMVILKNLKQKAENLYTEGEVYDPESGRTYYCKFWFDQDNENILNIRAYIGIPLLGKSEVLTRIE